MKKSMLLSKVHLMILLGIFSIAMVNAQEDEDVPSDMSHFLMTLQITKSNEMKMTCPDGCYWETLSFKNFEIGDTKAINENGTVNLEELEDESQFLFSIERTKEGFSLTSMYGTYWEDLSFTLKPDVLRSINEEGTVKE